MKEFPKQSFSLIEVAVTVTVLAVIVAGIVPAINNALKRAQMSFRKSTAHRLAQEKIEDLEGSNLNNTFFDNLFDVNGTPLNNASFQELENEAYGNLSLNTTNLDDPFRYFDRITEGSWDIDQDGNLTNETALGQHGNLSLIQVSVSWDFNNDTIADDDPIVVRTYKSAY